MNLRPAEEVAREVLLTLNRYAGSVSTEMRMAAIILADRAESRLRGKLEALEEVQAALLAIAVPRPLGVTVVRIVVGERIAKIETEFAALRAGDDPDAKGDG